MVTEVRTVIGTAFPILRWADVNAMITVCQTLFPGNRTIGAISRPPRERQVRFSETFPGLVRFPGKRREFAEASSIFG